MSLDLFNYYGLDWIAMSCGFLGMWLLGKKRKIGFLFSGISATFALAVSFIAIQYGFIVANLIMIAIAIRNYRLWYLEEKSNV